MDIQESLSVTFAHLSEREGFENYKSAKYRAFAVQIQPSNAIRQDAFGFNEKTSASLSNIELPCKYCGKNMELVVVQQDMALFTPEELKSKPELKKELLRRLRMPSIFRQSCEGDRRPSVVVKRR